MNDEHLKGKLFEISEDHRKKISKARENKDKLDEEFEGDDHEFYEDCYVPTRDI